VDTVEEQQICLENVIAINPNNEKAKKGLAALSAKGPSKPAAPPPPAAPSKPAAPAFPTDGFGDFDTNPFAGTGFDSNPYGSSTDPALDSQWDSFGASTDDSFSSIPSSVDWGRDSSAPAAYGSGKNVDQPSADEYDSWVSNLSLGGSSSTTESDFNPSSGPFGASDSFDFDSFNDVPAAPPDVPASSAPVSTNVSPFDDFDFSNFDTSTSNAFSTSFDSGASAGPFSADPSSVDLDNVPDPFGSSFARSSSPAPSSPVENDDPFASTANIDMDSDPFADLSPDATRNLFGGNKQEPKNNNAFGNSRATVFGGAVPEKEESTAAGGFAFIDSNSAPGKEAYFSAIPSEIQVDGSASRPSTALMLTVGALAVLNVLSIAFLFLNLTKH
jgi:hypothetical protein